MTMLSSGYRRRGEKLTLLLLLGMASIGCAATTRFAQLENVVRKNRLATGAEVQNVQVTRGGARLTTAPGMELEKGDRILGR